MINEVFEEKFGKFIYLRKIFWDQKEDFSGLGERRFKNKYFGIIGQ